MRDFDHCRLLQTEKGEGSWENSYGLGNLASCRREREVKKGGGGGGGGGGGLGQALQLSVWLHVYEVLSFSNPIH